MSMALFSPPHLPSTLSSSRPNYSSPLKLSLLPLHLSKRNLVLLPTKAVNVGEEVTNSAVKVEEKKLDEKDEKEELGVGSEGVKFGDPRWVGGTWDLKQFVKGGSTDWDAVIDAEARRRKWLIDNPESSSNDDPVVFDTSIIPWWSWVKRFHLPEAELLNGRAAMVGFFMAYFVDSLTGVGLVDQMGNFFCKTLLFVAVLGVLLIRKNEDIDTLKKLFEETTFYDKQWQATWQDENASSPKD
ncbi:hypothetical protein Scep_026533 [Stephania cephalantha]|uniref:Uncharacterized protein n=2 Tax=Stephania TaxID=147243 RepID=A0AAP0EU71_9MAGN